MVARPSTAAWRNLVHAFGDNLRRVARERSLEGPERSDIERAGRIEVYRRTAEAPVGHTRAGRLSTLWIVLQASLERHRPGGRSMIFRKENRGESFQRQISNLRHQMQSDEDQGDEFSYDQDTSQYPQDQPKYEEPYEQAEHAPDEPGSAAPMASRQTSWPARDASASVIAANAHWDGTLRSDGSLHVLGHADGELHAADDLFVAEGAEVDAQLFANNVVVAGTVRGKVEARSRLEVLPQGHVAGDVKAPKLVVHEGARLSGQLKMETSVEGGSAESAGQYSKSQSNNRQRRGGR